MAKVVADQRVRQGGKGKPVLIVLVASLILLGIYMVGLMSWSGSNTPTSPQQNSSQQSNAPASSSSATSGVPSTNPAYPAPAAPASGTPGSAATQR
jgi:flagellar basal body-associated protein FliL